MEGSRPAHARGPAPQLTCSRLHDVRGHLPAVPSLIASAIDRREHREERPRELEVLLAVHHRALPPKAISLIRSFMQNAPTDDSNYFTNTFGGAVKTSQPRGGTAFVHRDALYYAEPGAGWGTRGKPRSGDAITPKAQAWIAEFSQALRPYVNGACVNVPNIAMADWPTACWGSNFGRLWKIKAKYDPYNVFQYEQSIPPASGWPL
jgi:Berberine and berberine like